MKNQTYRMTMLFDFYGELLTDRQKEFFDLYYNNDLSLSEIAENAGISRQGVRDVIVRAENQMQEIEDKTGLIRRFEQMRPHLESIARSAAEIRSINYRQYENPRLAQLADSIAARKELSPELSLHRATQYLFFRQWNALRDFAHAHGVSLIGDLPIYTASDSADVWSAPREFQLDETGHPTEVAGCPPDGFSPDGQLWGNYLFAWDRMAEDGYAWWRRRVLFQLRLYDILRIDHFRGFDAYYAIPAGDDTAKNGRWRPGPGRALFQALTAAYGGEMPIIAEDLGFLSDSVRTLVRETGYPGMKVLELAFDSRDSGASDYLPHCVGEHCVAYTGTHDNDTILGWAATAPPADVAFARDYLKLGDRQDWNWAMMDAAWESPAELAVMQVQDLLGLGHEARMNTPSTLGGNWLWRLLPGELTEDLAQTVRVRMARFGRL